MVPTRKAVIEFTMIPKMLLLVSIYLVVNFTQAVDRMIGKEIDTPRDSLLNPAALYRTALYQEALYLTSYI